MHASLRAANVALVVLGVWSLSASGAPPKPPRAPAKIVLLGTFHFSDAGRDSYKPQHDVDILSQARQQEVEELLGCLEQFGPTKIAVEVPSDQGEALRSRYDAYLGGELDLSSNEIHQLGFRLAQRLGHQQVYPIDAKGRNFEPFVDPTEFAKEQGFAGQLTLSEAPWELYYQSLYAYEDRLKTEQSLREHLLYLNEEERILRSHGHYLIGTFKANQGDHYPGVDAKTAWYNRNLRILANLQKITAGDRDRILVVIGSGHLPILRHAVRASPEYELIDVESVLGASCRNAFDGD